MATRLQEELAQAKKQLEIERANLVAEATQVQQEKERIREESQQLNILRSQRAFISNTGEGSSGNSGTTMYTVNAIGHIREYAITEEFETWYEQYEEYVAVNNIPGDKSVSLFLTLIGQEGYKLLRNLCVPHKPKDKPLEELVTLVKNHVNPKPNIISERFKFKNRKQLPEENIGAFLASLKQISLTCEFADTLNTNIRDQLV